MNLRVGLIGAGRRMREQYVTIARSLGHEIVGFTTRTSSTAMAFSATTGIVDRSSIRGLLDERPDYLLVCVHASATMPVLDALLMGAFGRVPPTLIETPVEDPGILQRVARAGARVGVLEQWPYLPLEQFKELIYQSGLISRPYLVQNDCRSFDYHAVAQLRTYIGRHLKPVLATGVGVSAPLPDFVDQSGNLSTGARDSWEIGTVRFEDGSVLLHQFSYACKTAPFRSMQGLRAYSRDGTILTGRIHDRNDDCEIVDVMHLDGTMTRRLDVSVERHPSRIASISSSRGHRWAAPFELDDAMSASAMHLASMGAVVTSGTRPLYDITDAVMDQFLARAIKHAIANGGTVKLA